MCRISGDKSGGYLENRRTTRSEVPHDHGPPASVLLVHGAASGPWVFDGWAGAFERSSVVAVDLQAGLDVAYASMEDYALAVRRAASRMPQPVAVVAWSMGGLAAMLAAEEARPSCLVLMEPSPPAEIQGEDPGVLAEPGLLDGEATYGAFPAGVASRPESSLARAQRKAGISVLSLACPVLAVYGSEYRQERGRRIATLYGGAELAFSDIEHFGLVLDRRVRDAVAAHLHE